MALEVDQLKVYYRTLKGDVKALDDVSFTIADGEVMGLVGESGCGKTTLGKSLIRLDGRMRHVGGTVRLDGDDLPIGRDKAMQPRRYRDVSLIPQYAMSAMNPTRKIGRMIRELLAAKGERPDDHVDELRRRIELVGLSPDVLERYPIELSGGMKQRVVLVLATLLDPSLLIGDEVTSALDVSNQKAVAETLVEFRDREFVNSMVLITHDISVLYQVADTIMVMYAGRIAEKANADTIIDKPRHPYTRMLIGALPAVGIRHDVDALEGIEGRPPSLLRPPQGCRFRDRCPLATDRCATQPPLEEIAPGHQVACWNWEVA